MTDILFLHTPKFRNEYPLFGSFMSVTQMPAGLLGLADIASREGRSCQVIHLGVECIADPHYSLSEDLRDHQPGLVALSLHWHAQSADVIRAVGRIRRAVPDAFIVLGGYTASVFAGEILDGHPAVDAVIRGDAHATVSKLCARMPRRGDDLSRLPNLSWRRGETDVVHNPQSFVAEAQDLGDVSRTRFELLRHSDIYLELAQYLWFYRLDRSLAHNRRRFGHLNGFQLPMVLGCPFSCCYCGGGREAQQQISGRHGSTSVPLSRALAECRDLEGEGGDAFFMEYVPLGDGDVYYLDLFSGLRAAGTGLAANIECRSIPSVAFLDAFAATFPSANGSRLNVSPDTACESFRQRCKAGVPLSDADLWDVLQEMEDRGISSEIYFTIGLPGEASGQRNALPALVSRLRGRFSAIRAVRIHGVELDPGSPMALRPDVYGMADPIESFEDYCRHHELPGSMLTSFGYGVVDPEGGEVDRSTHAAQITALQCRAFCRAAQPFAWRLPGVLRATVHAGMKQLCQLHRASSRTRSRDDPFPS